MKQEHLQRTRRGRPLALATAFFAVSLFGLAGLRIALQDDTVPLITDPAGQSAIHQSVFPGGSNPSAAPDHALLSASDIERALPVPSRTAGMMTSVAS